MDAKQALDFLQSQQPRVQGIESIAGVRKREAFLLLASEDNPDRWAVVTTPGDRHFSVETDGFYSKNHFEEEPPDNEVTALLEGYVGIATAYVQGSGEVNKSGLFRTRSLVVEVAGQQVTLTQNLFEPLESLMRRSRNAWRSRMDGLEEPALNFVTTDVDGSTSFTLGGAYDGIGAPVTLEAEVRHEPAFFQRGFYLGLVSPSQLEVLLLERESSGLALKEWEVSLSALPADERTVAIERLLSEGQSDDNTRFDREWLFLMARQLRLNWDSVDGPGFYMDGLINSLDHSGTYDAARFFKPSNTRRSRYADYLRALDETLQSEAQAYANGQLSTP